jgi:hypothetical protein
LLCAAVLPVTFPFSGFLGTYRDRRFKRSLDLGEVGNVDLLEERFSTALFNHLDGSLIDIGLISPGVGFGLQIVAEDFRAMLCESQGRRSAHAGRGSCHERHFSF